MSRFISFAILAVLVYVAYTEGLPWLRQQLDQDALVSAGEGPARCVGMADRANDIFGDQVGRLSAPGGNADAWAVFVGDVDAAIGQARSACTCKEPSCRTALQAMTELRALLQQLDDRFRDGTARIRNPVERQKKINELLNHARGLARSGQ